MLLASPQLALVSRLACVICFQAPIGPAHTSGGCWKELRITAQALPSALSATLGSPGQPAAVTISGPVHSVVILPLATSSVARPLSPPTCSPKRISFDPGSHDSEAAEAFMSGVRLRGLSPEAGIT